MRTEPGEHDRPIRLLLINPRFPESFWSFRWAVEKILLGKRAINPPLGLATLAALCPPDWRVEIVDENIEPLPLAPQADIVGVCGMGVQFGRQRELLSYYRRRGCHTVAGGSYASLCPERLAGIADTVVAGEAEYIWREFCRDFQTGTVRSLYHETGVVRLEDSPTPRFDLLKLEQYTTVSLQFSRGCPYRCDFCDIIVMFGRRPRTKSPEQIGRELDVLRARNVRNLFFVDDNLIGNKKTAKALLQYLVDYQRRHRYTFRFGTEASLNLAEDSELLDLFRAANFNWVFIGIESPDADSLREIHKTQNMRQDLLAAVRAIYAHGIDVLAGFIVGFDNDTLAAFDKQRYFIATSGIQVAMVGLLTALPRTPLYERLRREGRLIPGAEHGDNTKPGTNFIPKRMDYGAMVRGYRALYRRLFSDRGIAERIRNKMRYLRRPVYRGEYPFRQSLGILRRLVTGGILRGGPLRLWRFAGTLAGAPPRAWPQVIVDWIAGLAMRDYVRRHFHADRARDRRLTRTAAAWLRRRCAAGVRRGALQVSAALERHGARLEVWLHGSLESAVLARIVRRAERLLRRTAAGVTLRIEELRADQRQTFDRLLQRLAPYGDRVSIGMSERVRALLPIDSSVFHVLLDERQQVTPAPL